MRETKIYCDHCGKVLDEMHDYVDIVVEDGKGYIETDLCTECINELHEIIETFCSSLKIKKSQDIK